MTQNAKPIFLWDNLLARTGASLSVSNSEADHQVHNLADWREYLTWQAGVAGSVDIIADLGSEESASALVLYGHNLFSGQHSTIALYGSSNGSDWNLILQASPDSDDPVLKIFPEVSYRFFRLNIAAGSIAARIGLLFLGPLLEFPSYPVRGFDPNEQETVVENSRSEEGYLLGTIIKHQQRKVGLEFDYLSDLWVREVFLNFWKAHVPLPFLFSWDYANHPRETYLVRVSEPKLELPYQPAYRSLKISLEGRV
jgi:hypothetical protein